MKEYQKKWYAKNGTERKRAVAKRKREIRDWFLEYKKTLSCSVCGFSGAKVPWCIEFHHIDPSTKTELVSYLVSHGYSRKRIMDEIAKCQPICANCHRADHYEKYKDNKERSTHNGKQTPIYKAERTRKRRRSSKQRRMGRDDDNIPGPTPKE